MSNHHSPDMSVVIVTDRYQTIRQTVRRLRAQTARDRLELVIVTPSSETLEPDDTELADFPWVRVVAVGTLGSLSWAGVPGIRQASAPLVALTESHSYPAPGWAEALIVAHQEPWAAVGPVIGNANPGSLVSWTNLLLDYGRWIDPAPAGEIDDLPGHNSSYKRALLLDYGAELETLLEAETVLHEDLRARGYRLYLEPAAKTYHLNVTLLSSWIAERFHAGRRFAAARAQHWSPLWRLLYTAGAPLIPLVRLPRILGDIRRIGRGRTLLPWILPALIVSLVVNAAGEIVGAACSGGNAMLRLSEMELNKIPHLAKRHRQAVTER
ncbi:MAG: glycosyltransferase [Deltaproteobacteria bacterium]|nr:glycosyltransferase [Deltaproteobacteria bacterium]